MWVLCKNTPGKKSFQLRHLATEYKHGRPAFWNSFINIKTYISEPQNMSRECACLFTLPLHIILGFFLSFYLHSVRHAEKGVCLFAFLTFCIFGIMKVGSLPSYSLNTFLSWKYLLSDSLVWCVEATRVLLRQSSRIS